MASSEQPAQFPEADGGGGRSGRGPSTHVPGEPEPGGVVPPYEGRKESADTDGEGEPGLKTVDGMTSPEPADTPGGATTSPADEQPATVDPDDEPADPGVGPAHVAGTTRGEQVPAGKPHNAGDEDNEGQSASDRPAGQVEDDPADPD
jgi:hypothetical protein